MVYIFFLWAAKWWTHSSSEKKAQVKRSFPPSFQFHFRRIHLAPPRTRTKPSPARRNPLAGADGSTRRRRSTHLTGRLLPPRRWRRDPWRRPSRATLRPGSPTTSWSRSSRACPSSPPAAASASPRAGGTSSPTPTTATSFPAPPSPASSTKPTTDTAVQTILLVTEASRGTGAPLTPPSRSCPNARSSNCWTAATAFSSADVPSLTLRIRITWCVILSLRNGWPSRPTIGPRGRMLASDSTRPSPPTSMCSS